MQNSSERKKLVDRAISNIRELFDGEAPSREILEQVKVELLELAKMTHLFSFDAFPPPVADDPRTSCLYRLSEDDDHRFALYANVATAKVDAPPHDHTTWAVIVGLHGEEENKFYKKVDAGVEHIGGDVVRAGTGVTLMPDDLHSIHIAEDAKVLNFHMYGLALEQLPGRNYWSAPKKEWRTFPAHTDIREARG